MATSIARLQQIQSDFIKGLEEHPLLEGLLPFQKQVVLRMASMEHPTVPFKCSYNNLSHDREIHQLADLDEREESLVMQTRTAYLILNDGSGKTVMACYLIRLVKELWMKEWLETTPEFFLNSFYSNGLHFFSKTTSRQKVLVPKTIVVGHLNRYTHWLKWASHCNLKVAFDKDNADDDSDILYCTPNRYKKAIASLQDRVPFRIILDDYSSLPIRTSPYVQCRMIWFMSHFYKGITSRGFFKAIQQHTRSFIVYCSIVMVEDELQRDIQSSMRDQSLTNEVINTSVFNVRVGMALCTIKPMYELFQGVTSNTMMERLLAATSDADCSLCCEARSSQYDGLFPCCQQIVCMACISRVLEVNSLQVPVPCVFCRQPVSPILLYKKDSHRVPSPTQSAILNILRRHVHQKVFMLVSHEDDLDGNFDEIDVVEWSVDAPIVSRAVIAYCNDFIKTDLSRFDVVILSPTVSKHWEKRLKGMLYFYPESTAMNKTMYHLTFL